MIQDLLDLALGANRVLCYAGYVLLAGTLTFWCVVWPDGRRNRRLVMLALAGTTAMIMGTIAGPAIQLIFGGQLLGDIVTPLGGAAQLARLAALIAANVLPSRHHQRCRGGLASHPRPHPGVGDRRVDGGAVQRHRRSLGDCQDRCYRPCMCWQSAPARWTPRPRDSFDPWREGAGAGSAHPALLASGAAECRDSDRDRHRARSGGRRWRVSAGWFLLRAGFTDQGLNLRPDVADGQRRPQVRGPRHLPVAASAARGTPESGRHLDPGRGDGSGALHRIRDLVDNLALGYGGAASIALAATAWRRTHSPAAAA